MNFFQRNKQKTTDILRRTNIGMYEKVPLLFHNGKIQIKFIVCIFFHILDKIIC